MAHLDTTATRRGSAKRNAAFTLQHGAILTTRQPEGCVPVVVSSNSSASRAWKGAMTRASSADLDVKTPCSQDLRISRIAKVSFGRCAESTWNDGSHGT